MELSKLIEQWGSDKNLSGYTPTYSVIFEPLRNKVMNVLEIGIGTLLPDIPSTFIGNPRHYPHYKPGGSLRAWRDYFPNAIIYGGDVATDCMFSDFRINTFLFDSTKKEECDSSLGDLTFDIVVDDGLHDGWAQLATFKNIWDRVNPGGIYVIEDILRPDVFKGKEIPEIRVIADNADVCFNTRGNMVYIKKY